MDGDFAVTVVTDSRHLRMDLAVPDNLAVAILFSRRRHDRTRVLDTRGTARRSEPASAAGVLKATASCPVGILNLHRVTHHLDVGWR